jgi:hypothetical protein
MAAGENVQEKKGTRTREIIEINVVKVFFI